MAYYKPQNLPAVDELFKNLAKGQTPNLFQMMSAISEISTLWPGRDNVCDGIHCQNEQIIPQFRKD